MLSVRQYSLSFLLAPVWRDLCWSQSWSIKRIVVRARSKAPQVQASHLQSLSQGLVDGHGIGKVKGKLQQIELDGVVRRNNGNPLNEGIFSLGTASQDGGLDDVKHEGLNNELCFFAKP